MESIYQKNQSPQINLSRDYDKDMSKLIEDNNILMNENYNLSKKIEKFEKMENDIKTKYVSKIEYDKKIKLLENEKQNYYKLIKDIESKLEKKNQENITLMIRCDDLKQINEQNEILIEEYKSNTYAPKLTEISNNNNLDYFLTNNQEDDLDENENNQQPNHRRVVSKLRYSDKDLIDMNENSVRNDDDKGENTSEDARILGKLMKGNTFNEEENKNIPIILTQLNFEKIQHEEPESTTRRSDRKILTERRFSKRKTIFNKDNDYIFKEFFKLSFQSIKLNSENIEPFLHVL